MYLHIYIYIYDDDDESRSSLLLLLLLLMPMLLPINGKKDNILSIPIIKVIIIIVTDIFCYFLIFMYTIMATLAPHTLLYYD